MKGAPLPPIGRSNTALVLHDMQNDFLKASLSRPEMHAVVKRTKALIDLARSLPVPVIYTRVESDPAMTFPPERASYLRRSGPPICVKGSAGAEVIDELKPAAGDYLITKVRSSAFHETTYSATPEAQAASLANIDDFLGYVMNSGEVVEMLKR
jgi:nicotinamidase-related amidase